MAAIVCWAEISELCVWVSDNAAFFVYRLHGLHMSFSCDDNISCIVSFRQVFIFHDCDVYIAIVVCLDVVYVRLTLFYSTKYTILSFL